MGRTARESKAKADGKTMNKAKFILKRPGELTPEEKKGLNHLSIREYPKFKRYYKKNLYYSTIKPQGVFIIKREGKIVGTGKFLWRNITLNNKQVKMAAFGVLIDRNHKREGFGTKLIKLQIKEAKRIRAGFLYGSTANTIAERLLLNLGFVNIKIPIFYKEVSSKKIKKVKIRSYVLELKKGALKEIKKEKRVFIGSGPI